MVSLFLPYMVRHNRFSMSPRTTAFQCSSSLTYISSDTDTYQEEIISLRHNLQHNNYPERITSAPRNLDRRMEDNTQKLTTVCLSYVKWLAERIQKICGPYDIRTVFTSGSTLRRYQATNGIQHDQELCLLHPLQLG